MGDILRDLQFALVSQHWHDHDDKSFTSKHRLARVAQRLFMVQWNTEIERWSISFTGCSHITRHNQRTMTTATLLSHTVNNKCICHSNASQQITSSNKCLRQCVSHLSTRTRFFFSLLFSRNILEKRRKLSRDETYIDP